MKKQITTQKIKNCRFFIFAFFLLGLSSIVFGQTSIKIMDFDGTATEWSFTNDVAFFDNNSDGFYGIHDANNDLNDGTPMDTGDGNPSDVNQITNPDFTGDFLFVNDLDDEGDFGTPGEATITFSTVDVSTYNSVEISFDYDIVGFDSTDYFKYEVLVDGASLGVIDLPKNANGNENIPIADSSSSVHIKFYIKQNGGSDQAGLDNIVIKGIAIPTNATDSDVIAASALFHVPGGNISSVADTPAEAVDVFSFDIRDSGAVDTLPTEVTKIRIKPSATNTADWTDFIQGFVVKDAFTNSVITPTSVTITDNFIDLTFNVGDITAADNDDQVVTLAVYLNTTNIIDNKVLSFKIDDANHGFLADPSGSTFATTFPNGPVVSEDFTVQVNATEMRFVQQPTDVVINTIMNPAVIVFYTDENGNRDRDFSDLGVTATLSTNGSAFDPSVTTDGTPVNGAMVFNNIKYTIIDTDVTLTITDTSGLIANQTATSTAFNVTAPKCNINTGITIGQQDFEVSPAPPILPTTKTATVLFSTGNGAFPNAPKYVSPNIGVEVNNATGTIIFGPVDTSKYENISFSIRLASFSATSTQGADSTDFVKLNVQNGASSISNEIWIKGNNNSKWSFTSGTGIAQIAYDNNNVPAIFQPSNGGNQTTEGYSTIKITNLPKTNSLTIILEIKNNDNREFWVLDDAVLTGDQKEYTVWDNTTQTWSNGIPNRFKKAYFDTDYDTGLSDINACEIEVVNGVTVKVGPNEFLKVGNDFINNGHVLVANNGSIVQLNDNVSIIGSNFNIERRTTPYRMYDYTYWSSPVEDADLGVVFANNPQGKIYAFDTSSFNDDSPADSFDDENDDWTQVSGLMTPGKGYIVMGQGSQFPVPNPIPTTTQQQTVNLIGKINNGNISVPVSLDNSATDSFTNQNLIGNPYPSAIDARLLLEQNSNLSGTLYFWTHNDQISSANPGPDTYNFTNDSYVTYTAGTGGAQGNCGGCTIPTDFIASGQAFFADVDDASVPVVFKNNMRVTGDNDNFYRTPQNEKNRIWLNMTTNTNDFRQILIGFFDDATDNYDNYFDGRRLENGNSFDFYSLIGNEKFAVQGVTALVNEKTIPVGVEVPVDAQLTFSIDRFEGDLDQVNVYLKDNVLNVIHNLKQGNYVIDMTQGEYPNRFEIIFSRSALATNEQTIATTNNLIVANSNNGVLVKLRTGNMKNIQVYDVIGKLITNKNVQTNEVDLNNNYLSGTVYFVKVTLENGNVLTKKIIKM